MSKRLVLPVAAGLLLVAAASAQMPPRAATNALAQSSRANPNPGVVPPNARVMGQNYADWGAAWWRWAYSIPFDQNPITDPDGRYGHLGQSGPVWFVAGTSGTTNTRTIPVPAGKHVFFPIINFISDWPCPGGNFCEGIPLQQCLRDQATFFMDAVTELEVTVDGNPLRMLRRYRATSDVFMFTGHPSNVQLDSCITGTPQPGLSDGYWIMLEPLPTGAHVIHFRGKLVIGSFEFETQLTVNLLVG